jgi:hypothetical protein
MAETLTNQEKANLLMGIIFADLLAAWPTRIDLSSKEALQSLFGNVTREDDLLYLWLMKWLADEGYIQFSSSTHSGTYSLVVLSEKGLRTLNSMPAGISNNKSYGERITEAAKEVTKESAKRTITDLVGQMIGGVIKSLSSG